MKNYAFVGSLQNAEVAKAFVARLSQSFPGFSAKNRGRNVYVQDGATSDDVRRMIMHMAIGFDWANTTETMNPEFDKTSVLTIATEAELELVRQMMEREFGVGVIDRWTDGTVRITTSTKRPGATIAFVRSEHKAIGDWEFDWVVAWGTKSHPKQKLRQLIKDELHNCIAHCNTLRADGA